PKGYELPAYAGWRKLVPGSCAVVLAIGPVAGPILGEILALTPENRPELWVLTELPMGDALPIDFLNSIQRCGDLIVVEEHVLQGSVGQMIAHRILSSGIKLTKFEHA